MHYIASWLRAERDLWEWAVVLDGVGRMFVDITTVDRS